MSWKESVNQTLGTTRISNIHDYVVDSTLMSQSPIDRFYTKTREILMAGTPALLISNNFHGPLFLVGIVSATENYFRELFSAIIKICPIAKASASDQSVKLGSVFWNKENIERGAFEHLSFADSSQIISSSTKSLKYPLSNSTLFKEFDKICQLRHSIVHSDGTLGAKNAIHLNISPSISSLVINVHFSELQEAASICTALIVSINQELFIELAKRWATEWRSQPSWNPHKENPLFKEIWNLFYSRLDAANLSIADQMTMIKCRNKIMAEFP